MDIYIYIYTNNKYINMINNQLDNLRFVDKK